MKKIGLAATLLIAIPMAYGGDGIFSRYGGDGGISSRYGDSGPISKRFSDQEQQEQQEQQTRQEQIRQEQIRQEQMRQPQEQQAQPRRGITKATGEYLVPAGQGFTGTRDGHYYAPAGPNGVIDTQTGQFIPVH